MDPEGRHAAAGTRASSYAQSPAGSPQPSSCPTISAVDLSSIELGLLASFNLEMADSYNEVEADPKLSLETRQAARESASRHRERAQLFQFEAQRLCAYPTLPTGQPTDPHGPRYAGPERRKRERRTRDRRGSQPSLPGASQFVDRRANRDRRQRERRGEIQHAR
jgi:hypothetical protein